jgi:signal peptidase I
MENQENASTLKKFWNFVWKDDSVWSWIVSLILAFIIVRFIFFPLLSLTLATSLPLVVVESGSMHHPGGFLGNTVGTTGNVISPDAFSSWWENKGRWYQEKGINEKEAESWPLRTGLEKGDIVIVYGRSKQKIGDIIIFEANQAHPIIHRIISISTINGKTVYGTKGDNNPDQLFVEKQIPEDVIVGKAVFRIPKLGWLKLIFVELFNAIF